MRCVRHLESRARRCAKWLNPQASPCGRGYRPKAGELELPAAELRRGFGARQGYPASSYRLRFAICSDDGSATGIVPESDDNPIGLPSGAKQHQLRGSARTSTRLDRTMCQVQETGQWTCRDGYHGEASDAQSLVVAAAMHHALPVHFRPAKWLKLPGAPAPMRSSCTCRGGERVHPATGW